MRVLQKVVASHVGDAQLQYRGVALLEKLEPGCTAAMPRQARIRSQAIKTDELVRLSKRSAELNAAEGLGGSARVVGSSSRGSRVGTGDSAAAEQLVSSSSAPAY